MNETSTTITLLIVGILCIIAVAATTQGTMFGPLSGYGFLP